MTINADMLWPLVIISFRRNPNALMTAVRAMNVYVMRVIFVVMMATLVLIQDFHPALLMFDGRSVTFS
jgi:hypothetical protein